MIVGKYYVFEIKALRHSAGFFHTFDAISVYKPNGEKYPPRKVHIFVPRNYEGSNQRYPVVYFNDGNTTFWPGGLANKSWKVAFE